MHTSTHDLSREDIPEVIDNRKIKKVESLKHNQNKVFISNNAPRGHKYSVRKYAS